MYKTPLEAWHYGFVEEGNFERESYYINDAAVHLADAIASNGNIETLFFMKHFCLGPKMFQTGYRQ